MCEEQLCTNLSTDTVSQVLVLADLHSAEQLKQHAIDYTNRSVPNPIALAFFSEVSHQYLLWFFPVPTIMHRSFFLVCVSSRSVDL